MKLPAAMRLLLAGVFLLIALYCGTDPLGHRPMVDFPGFETYAVDLPPLSEVPNAEDREDLLQRAEVRFLNQVQGPESIAFDLQGHGPYTGVADGRILFWNGQSWEEFAYTSPNRSAICDPKPSPLSYIKNEHICGRPLGLRFHKKTGELYIADAYFGLLKVGPDGGVATQLTREAEGVPFNLTNDLDIDEEGNVYFTDSSTNFQRRNFVQLVLTAEPSGRLLKFNPATKETTVLLRNLQFPNGVSLSKDGSFFVFAEGCRPRLMKYWIKGEKAGTSEILVHLPGVPDNVRTNEKGEFWVALFCRRSPLAYLMGLYPRVMKFFLRLPIKAKYQLMMRTAFKLHGVIMKYSPDGELLQVLEDRQGKVVRAVSEVEEKDGQLWLGSALMPFMAVYKL